MEKESGKRGIGESEKEMFSVFFSVSPTLRFSDSFSKVPRFSVSQSNSRLLTPQKVPKSSSPSPSNSATDPALIGSLNDAAQTGKKMGVAVGA